MSFPHNGDRLRIEVTVEPGADLHVTSAAASIALPGLAPGFATYDITLRVGRAARLHWLPEPTIIATGSDLRQHIKVELAPTARLLLTEQQILGRAHEPPGRLTSRLTVRRGIETLLDQRTTYGPGTPGWDGPAVLPATARPVSSSSSTRHSTITLPATSYATSRRTHTASSPRSPATPDFSPPSPPTPADCARASTPHSTT